MNRKIVVERNTKETQIKVELNLDGTGIYKVNAEVGFLEHMLELFSKHSLIDLEIKACGDTNRDNHHLIEDVGIVLGQAISKALGEKKGIKRYGSAIIPMDEVLCLCAVDMSGRYSFETDYKPVRENVNDFPTEMFKDFFKALALNAEINLHIQFLNQGENEHHRIEAAFKAFARALRVACEIDERAKNILPSTKEKL
ncbi:MAG: imidazoleglycerol-phosphate dehydratase HisB [Candidatus Gracilibacteria bacterium]|jgi:imidazoleglycerol-phosphate dehydratase